MSKNSYYLIELPGKSTVRLNEVLSMGKHSDKPRENLHVRFSLDRTKAIVQGDIDTILDNFTKSKNYITYLGDCLENGRAEQKVYDYLTTNSADWIAPEVAETKK